MNTTKKYAGRLVLLVTVSAIAAIAGGRVAMKATPNPPPPTPTAVVVRAPSAPTVGRVDEAETDVAFPTTEQAQRYYGALAAGDRRALVLLDTALVRARTEGMNPEHAARLEALRAQYQRRSELHEAKLRI